MSKGIEIERKYAVRASAWPLVSAAISETCTSVGQEDQSDWYYDRVGGQFLDESYPYQWLSIRQRADKGILSYKRFHPEGAEEHDYADEYELPLSDTPESVAELHWFLGELGFERRVRVDKVRATYRHLRTKALVLVDQVDHLGTFIEVELQSPGIDREQANRLFELAELELAIADQPRDLRGYPFLLLEKYNDKTRIEP